MKENKLYDLNKLFPARTISMTPDESQLVFKLEKNISFLGTKHPVAQKVYSRFYEDLLLYLSKMSSSVAKQWLESIINRKLVYIGSISGASKTGIIGTMVLLKNKLCGIVLESTELGINTLTGETSNIDQCFFASYFQFIRSAVIINKKEIIKDSELHKMISKYLSLLCLKFIGNNVSLNDKQKLYLDIVSSYFYYRFMLVKHHDQAKEMCLIDYDKNIKSEIEHLMLRLSKYTNMKDIFKGLIDFNIIVESPNLLVMKALNKFKSFGFYSFTSSLDYLISYVIVSKYPVDFCSNGLVNQSLQNQVEKHMSKYFKEVTFDINCLSHL